MADENVCREPHTSYCMEPTCPIPGPHNHCGAMLHQKLQRTSDVMRDGDLVVEALRLVNNALVPLSEEGKRRVIKCCAVLLGIEVKL